MYANRKLKPDDRFPLRELTTVTGALVTLPQPAGLVHLQLRRFAGCPVCHLHLRSLVRRREELAVAGIREVVVFHSPAADLVRYVDDVPFDLVADPEKRLYAELGAEAGARSLLDPRAWGPILWALLVATVGLVRGRPLPPLRPPGGRLGLPADFLIAGDGTVLASKYGRYADDQWSADELLALAAGPGDTVSSGAGGGAARRTGDRRNR